jgi:hypothetical protein
MARAFLVGHGRDSEECFWWILGEISYGRSLSRWARYSMNLGFLAKVYWERICLSIRKLH